jgi:hypothetical protein
MKKEVRFLLLLVVEGVCMGVLMGLVVVSVLPQWLLWWWIGISVIVMMVNEMLYGQWERQKQEVLEDVPLKNVVLVELYWIECKEEGERVHQEMQEALRVVRTPDGREDQPS